MFVACAFASIYNATINQDSIFCIPTKPFLCIILTLLICWAFLCVAVFCLNATRTDLWRVRVLLSRAQPFGPSLSENTTIGYKTWACRSTPVKNQLHHVWLFSVYFETVDCSRENLNWWDFDWDFSHIESVRGGGGNLRDRRSRQLCPYFKRIISQYLKNVISQREDPICDWSGVISTFIGHIDSTLP